MTSTGVLIVLGLLALLGWWIVKDKTFDGFAPFVVINVLFIGSAVLHMLYLAAKRWLF